jgi:hypothetical protein
MYKNKRCSRVSRGKSVYNRGGGKIVWSKGITICIRAEACVEEEEKYV